MAPLQNFRQQEPALNAGSTIIPNVALKAVSQPTENPIYDISKLPDSQVLPIYRYIKGDAILTLINTGKPSDAYGSWQYDMKDRHRYPQIESTRPRIKDTEADSKSSSIVQQFPLAPALSASMLRAMGNAL